MEVRLQRIAENEARFRAINEELRGNLDGLPLDDDRVAFVCECGEAGCSSPVTLSLAAYEAVRGDGRRFAVLPGHEKLHAESVVERHDDYLVVEKDRGPGPRIALESDPRA
jgi:hypothetical protein